jgi:hypothetical protein
VPARYLVALEPGYEIDEKAAKLHRACPRCEGDLWYYAESPTYPGPSAREEAELELTEALAHWAGDGATLARVQTLLSPARKAYARRLEERARERDPWLPLLTAVEKADTIATARSSGLGTAYRQLLASPPGMKTFEAARVLRYLLPPGEM